MDQQDGRSELGKLLQRPRLNMLLSQGILHPLIMIVAGAGYGKTTAVRQFAEKTGERVIWFSANYINNYTERFWRTVVDAIGKEMPALAKKLKELPFPRSFKEQDAFLRLFADAIYEGKHVLFVLDDIQNIENEDIKQFFCTLLEAGLENFCLVGISSAKYHTYFRPKMPNGSPFRITADDLRFTDEETGQMLTLHGIAVNNAVIASAQKATEGWPLALHVLASHWKNRRNLFTQTPFSIEQFLDLFYRDYYTQYSVDIQQLLIKLSHLPMFSLEIISGIGGCDLHEIIHIIRTNPFIQSDYATSTHTFQVVYKHFLTNCFVLDDAELARIYRIAADYYAKNDFTQDAVALYGKAGAYDLAFEVMRTHPYERLTLDTASAFEASLLSFPPEYVEKNPLARVYLASIQARLGKREESEALLRALLRQYASVPEVAGEIYLNLAELVIETDLDEAIACYARACDCLPNGTVLRVSKALYFINKSLVKLPDTRAGALERHVKKLEKVVEYSSRLYKRSHQAWYDLLRAEVAFYQLDMDAARKLAYEAVYTAALHTQYDIQCNAWFLLLRIEMMYGNLEKAEDFCNKIDTLILEREISSLFILRDCVDAWFHLKLRDYRGIPKWLADASGEELARVFPSSERDIGLQIMYRVETGDYAHALAIISALKPFCESQMFWTVRMYLLLEEAIVHAKCGNPEETLRAFRELYDLTYANRILAPLIEAGYHLRSVISTICKLDHGMDEAWLDNLYTKTNTYAKRMNIIARNHEKKRTRAPAERTTLNLSDREIEVLEYLTQGLKYEEISDSMDISINGVKKHITSIYSKLGAINRADAIYIAMSEGIIK